MKFFDDKSKNVNWYNRNYFYLGTIILITLNIFIFALWGNDWGSKLLDNSTVNWDDTLNFNNLYASILNCIEHSNWSHVLLNMACFSVCGIYLERKTGTFNFLLLVIGVLILDAGVTSGAYLATHWHGWSGVLYAFYAIVYVDYFFSFNKHKRNKTNTILGAIICVTIYIFMSASRFEHSIKFYPYPRDLIDNIGHYSAFLVGTIVGLIVNMSQLKILKQSTRILQEKQPLSTKLKTAYTSVLVGIILLITSCSIITGVAINRTNANCSLTFDCNYDEFDYIIEKEFTKDKHNTYGSYRYEWQSHFSSQLENYGFEFYLDSTYKKQMTDDYENKYTMRTQPWGYGDTIPLMTSIHQTIYVKLYKIYKIEFLDCADYIDLSYWTPNKLQEENLFWSKDYLTNQIAVKENENLKFKLEGLKYSTSMLKLFANGTELIIDSNGYYEINNISNDIQITYSII